MSTCHLLRRVCGLVSGDSEDELDWARQRAAKKALASLKEFPTIDKRMTKKIRKKVQKSISVLRYYNYYIYVIFSLGFYMYLYIYAHLLVFAKVNTLLDKAINEPDPLDSAKSLLSTARALHAWVDR